VGFPECAFFDLRGKGRVARATASKLHPNHPTVDYAYLKGLVNSEFPRQQVRQRGESRGQSLVPVLVIRESE
jgi:hypothetical protein